MPTNFVSRDAARARTAWPEVSEGYHMTLYCRCGGTWRGNVKGVRVDGQFVQITQAPCPRCGEYDRLWRASSDPERLTL